jgi:hypothetical protein
MNKVFHYQLFDSKTNTKVYDSQKEKGLKGFGNKLRAERDIKGIVEASITLQHLKGSKLRADLFEVAWTDLPIDHQAMRMLTHMTQVGQQFYDTMTKPTVVYSHEPLNTEAVNQ